MKFNPIHPSSGRAVRATRGVQTLLLTALVTLAPVAAHAVTQTKIFFVSDRDGANSIYTADADGANPSPAPLIRNARNPALSPQGDRLAFVQNDDIYIVNVSISGGAVIMTGPNGGAPTPLTNDGGTVVDDSPSFSPSGNRLIFERGPSADPDLFTVNSDGSSRFVPKSVFARTGAANSPRFVGENQIVFAARGRAPLSESTTSLVSFVLDSPTESFTVEDPAGGNASVLRVTVSPLDRKLVYSRTGSTLRGLYRKDLGSPPISALSASASGDNFPSFSPDGTKIIFSSTAPARGGSAKAAEIYVFNADGSGLMRLTNNAANDFAPVIGDITVIGAVNAPPVLNNATYTAGLNVPFSVQLVGTDTDGDTLTYAVAPNFAAPAGLTLSTTGVLSGTPTAAGTARFSVTVSDGKGGTATGKFAVAVRNVAGDLVAPTITRNTLPASATRNQYAGLTLSGDVADTAQTGAAVSGVRRVLAQLRSADSTQAFNGTAFTSDLTQGYYLSTVGAADPNNPTAKRPYTRTLNFLPQDLAPGNYVVLLYPQDNAGNYAAEYIAITVTANATVIAPPQPILSSGRES